MFPRKCKLKIRASKMTDKSWMKLPASPPPPPPQQSTEHLFLSLPAAPPYVLTRVKPLHIVRLKSCKKASLYRQQLLFTTCFSQHACCVTVTEPAVMQTSPFIWSGSAFTSHRCRSAGRRRSCSCCWMAEGSRRTRGWRRSVPSPSGWVWTDSAHLSQTDRQMRAGKMRRISTLVRWGSVSGRDDDVEVEGVSSTGG